MGTSRPIIPPLPPGFVLDAGPKAIPPLPPGFILDEGVPSPDLDRFPDEGGPPPLDYDGVAAAMVTGRDAQGRPAVMEPDILKFSSLGGVAPPVVRPAMPLPPGLATPAVPTVGGGGPPPIGLQGDVAGYTGPPIAGALPPSTPTAPVVAMRKGPRVQSTQPLGGPPPLAEAIGGALMQQEEALASPEAQRVGQAVFQGGLGTLIPPPKELGAMGFTGPEVAAAEVLRAALAVTTSPESFAIMLAAPGVSAAVKALANSPRAVKLLRGSPQLTKLVDIASEIAVPGAMAGLGGAEVGAAIPDIIEKEGVERWGAVGRAVGGAGVAAIAGRQALREGAAVTARQPGPVTGKESIGEMKRGATEAAIREPELAEAGHRLSAEQWQQRAQQLAQQAAKRQASLEGILGGKGSPALLEQYGVDLRSDIAAAEGLIKDAPTPEAAAAVQERIDRAKNLLARTEAEITGGPPPLEQPRPGPVDLTTPEKPVRTISPPRGGPPEIQEQPQAAPPKPAGKPTLVKERPSAEIFAEEPAGPPPLVKEPPAVDRYAEALKVVQDAGRASTSVLQRALKMPYAEAARYIERMRAEGVIPGEVGGPPPLQEPATFQPGQRVTAHDPYSPGKMMVGTFVKDTARPEKVVVDVDGKHQVWDRGAIQAEEPGVPTVPSVPTQPATKATEPQPAGPPPLAADYIPDKPATSAAEVPQRPPVPRGTEGPENVSGPPPLETEGPKPETKPPSGETTPRKGLPPNQLIQFPSGRWGFVGSVDPRLAFEEGFTEEQIKAGQQAGERFGPKKRTFATQEEAEAALTSLSVPSNEEPKPEALPSIPSGKGQTQKQETSVESTPSGVGQANPEMGLPSFTAEGPPPLEGAKGSKEGQKGQKGAIVDVTPGGPPETHKFSSTQVNLPEGLGWLTGARDKIAEEDLAEQGREMEPHITVKYGLHTDDPEAVRKALAGQGPITLTAGKTSLFPDSGDGEVVKVDVDSPDLHRLNKLLADAIEHTDTHPEYKPHITLAYVKPGTGQKYVGMDDVEGMPVTVDTLRFSTAGGQKFDIKLEGPAKVSPEQQPGAMQPKKPQTKPPEDLSGPPALVGEGQRLFEKVTGAKTYEEARAGLEELYDERRESLRGLKEDDWVAFYDHKGTIHYGKVLRAPEDDDFRTVDIVAAESRRGALKGNLIFTQPIPWLWRDTEQPPYPHFDLPMPEDRPALPAPRVQSTQSEEGGPPALEAAATEPAAATGPPPLEEPEAAAAPAPKPPRPSAGGGGATAPRPRPPAAAPHPRPVGASPSPTNRADNSRDHRITEDDLVGEGGARAKLKQNIAAIRLLKQLEAEDRPATAEEKRVLVKYVGWGMLSQAFGHNREWQGARADLEELLTPEEFAAARASSTNAHYTSPEVVRGIWKAVERLGLQPESLVLEPAVGIGHFFGLQPDSLMPARRTGVELDPLTARIAKHLYPDAAIHNAGFQDVKLPESFFDLAVSNVPFGNYGVRDPKFKKFPGVTKSIHNYFFAKALDVVRPGGVVAFITSSYTMDSKDPTIRKYLSERGRLLGAIRLPNTAFKGNAGTEVTTDIIFIQKMGPMDEKPESWTELAEIKGKNGETMQVNEYYARHPEMMLGQMSLEGSMYAEATPTLEGEFSAEALDKAIQNLPENVIPEHSFKPSEVGQKGEMMDVPDADFIKEGAFFIQGNQVAIREGTKHRPSKLVGVRLDRVKGMIGIRGAIRDVLRTQIQSDDAGTIKKAQAHLNKVYDAFVKKHGFLSATANSRVFHDDPDAPLLLSLENWDQEKKTATKTDAFTKRTIERAKAVDKVDKASEALAISLNEMGRIDWTRMQELTGKTPDELRDELGPLVWLDPVGRRWVTADEYLSGNVREALQAAETAAAGDAQFTRNVEALRAVQPEDLKPGDIHVRLGAPWIPATDIRQFVANLLRGSKNDVQVYYIPQTATWHLRLEGAAKRSVANMREWGTPRVSAAELIDDALNSRVIKLYDIVRTPEGGEKRVLNQEQTLLAQDKQSEILDRFTTWVWEDAARMERLARVYNDEFNNLVDRKFDGSHLTMPGMVRTTLHNQDLRPSQKGAIWRIIQTGNTLLAHVVGAGKTFTMIGAAMELKRLGLARKPMVIVPNHLVEQWASDFYRIYPTANLFIAGKEWFAAGKRQQAMSRIATGNWDAVVVSHNSFGKLPLAKATREAFYQEQLDELEQAIELASVGEGKKSPTVKELEKAKKRLETKLKNLANEESDDNTVTFEELGVDQLFVDEADLFKNLFFVTRMTRLAGLPNSESQRAFDMYMKTRHVQGQTPGRGVVFATGTPISNTIAEMFTVQRYLQPQALEAAGLRQFDAWARTFGDAVTGFELAPEGSGYRQNTRFAKFANFQELKKMFRMVADVQTAKMLNLPVPKIKGGAPKAITAPSTPELKDVMAGFVGRAERVRGGQVRPDEDNMLKIMSEGRKAALDLRILLPGSPDYPHSKINKAVDTVHKIWDDTADERSTQLIFADLSTPKGSGPGKWARGTRVQFESSDGDIVTGIIAVSPRQGKLTVITPEGESVTVARTDETLQSLEDPEAEELARFSIYQDIKSKLVARGVPADEVAFIHDAKTDMEKKNLFKAVNSGRVRVLMGSTEKMGAGMNVQKKLIALHHLDAPWRPRDVGQRNGRIERQGNENEEVQIYTYLTEGSMDAYSWQTLAGKAAAFENVMSDDNTAREVEDVGVFVVSAQEFMAIASGSPLIKEKIETDAQVRKLITLRGAYQNQLSDVRRRLARVPDEIANRKAWLKSLAADKETVAASEKTLTLGKRTFTGENARKEGADALAKLVDSWMTHPTPQHVGSYAGLELWTDPHPQYQKTELRLKGQFQYGVNVNRESPSGTMSSLEYAAKHYIDTQIESAETGLERLKKEQADLAEQSDKPFQRADELAGLLKRQKELTALLDINKNQHQAMDDAPADDADAGQEEAEKTAGGILRDFIKSEEGFADLGVLAQRLGQAAEKLSQARDVVSLTAKTQKEAYFGPNGLAHWANLGWHTPRYVGELHPPFLPFVDRAAASAEERDERSHRLGQILQPYFDLPDDKRKVLDSRLIDARFEGKSEIRTGGLDEAQLTAYGAVRSAMTTALEWMADLVVDITSGGKVASAQGIFSVDDAAAALEDEGVDEERVGPLAEKMFKILEEIREAQAKGYVPFSRFGDYTYGIYPTAAALADDPDLLPVHEQRETAAAASARYLKIINMPRYRALLASGKYTARPPKRREKKDREFLRQLGGFEIHILAKIAEASPEFAEAMMGDSKEELGKLAEAVQRINQGMGFKAHFLEAKMVPGFERDLDRPFADYVVSISRHIANAKMFRDFSRYAQRLPKNQPKLRKYATSYVEYMRSAPEELGKIRGALFHWYLGIANPMAALVNLTQPVMMSAPWMLQYAGPDKVGAELLKAYRDVMGAMAPTKLEIDYAKLPEDIREDAKAALADGTLKAQTAQELHGIAKRRSKALTKAERMSTFLFSGAEHVNRLVSFIAMARMWTAKKPTPADVARTKKAFKKRDRRYGLPVAFFPSAREFAEHGVRITQLEYGRYNKPALFRGKIGALLGVFKMFSVGQIELALRLMRSTIGGVAVPPKPPRRGGAIPEPPGGQGGPEGANYARQKMAFMAWIGIMVAAAGLMGLPFVDVAVAVAELGWKTAFKEEPNWHAEWHQFLTNLTTPEIGDFLMHGGSWLTPYDLSRSLGMGDPIGAARAIRTGELLPSISAALAIPGRVGEGIGDLAAGEGGRALEALAPRTGRGLAFAGRLVKEGLRTRAGGQILPKESFGPPEIAGAAASVPLTKVSKAYEREREVAILDTGSQGLKGQIVHRFARAVEAQDEKEIERIAAEIDKYNETHGDVITEQSIKDAIALRMMPPEERHLRRLPRGQRHKYFEGGPPPLEEAPAVEPSGPPPIE